VTAGALLSAARAKGLRIATAESCTGGLVAGAITDVAGSSDIFDRGWITYSNAAKTGMLGVSPVTIARFGAVSEEVAVEMAAGARTRSLAQIAVAVTGIAGPGGSGIKPEGRVCFALATPQGTQAETHDFGARGRAAVRAAAVAHALKMLLQGVEAQP
jgi:nicotinamide-nucleotide amidase